MTAQLRAELLKHRSTFANLGLVLLAVLLHALTLPADRLESASDQVQVFRFGSLLGALFAGLVGAMSITGEIRHGTIRPTFLITPRRGRVVAAKIVASALVGIVFGLVAVSAAVGAGSAALAARGIPITLDGSDYTLMPAGGIAAAALWAPLGLGLGALLRNQVATLLAIFLWLFFVENLLLDFVPGAGRFAPGAAAAAITGLDPRQAARPRPRCAPARPLRRDNRGRRLDRHPPPRCPLNRIPGARAVAVRRPLRSRRSVATCGVC
ncbi:MAG: ABC transporter permease subunit [Thermoleophilaceae bacterium]